MKPARLSYNQQRLLEVLPREIEQCEKEIAATEEILGNGNLYLEDREKFETLSNRLAELKQNKEEAENRWLELQLLKEELEKQA